MGPGPGPGPIWAHRPWTMGTWAPWALAHEPKMGPKLFKMYKKIIHRHFKMPKHLSKDCKAVLDGLLRSDPAKRYGVFKGKCKNK